MLHAEECFGIAFCLELGSKKRKEVAGQEKIVRLFDIALHQNNAMCPSMLSTSSIWLEFNNAE